MRIDFESWAIGVGLSVDPENAIATGGRFKNPETQSAWEGWQAACLLAAQTLENLSNDADPDDFASIALREAANQLKGA